MHWPLRHSLFASIAAIASLYVAPLALAANPSADAPAVTVRAFGGANNEPFNFQDASGRFTGLGVEVVEALAKRSGVALPIEVLPWPRALALARSQSASLVFTVARNAERESWFHWLGPIAPREVWLWKLARRQDIAIETLDDARRFRVGEVTSNATVDQLKRLGWTTGVNLDISMHDADIGRKMKAGRVDLVAMNPYSIAAFAQQSEIALSELQPVLLLTREGGYFLGLNLDTPPEVRQRLERAMRQMRDDGSLDAIARRWRAPLSHRLAN